VTRDDQRMLTLNVLTIANVAIWVALGIYYVVVG
jgi:hypothetical protein